jgi:hypothetical protein
MKEQYKKLQNWIPMVAMETKFSEFLQPKDDLGLYLLAFDADVGE